MLAGVSDSLSVAAMVPVAEESGYTTSAVMEVNQVSHSVDTDTMAVTIVDTVKTFLSPAYQVRTVS